MMIERTVIDLHRENIRQKEQVVRRFTLVDDCYLFPLVSQEQCQRNFASDRVSVRIDVGGNNKGLFGIENGVKIGELFSHIIKIRKNEMASKIREAIKTIMPDFRQA
jgi:hypothetical protein